MVRMLPRQNFFKCGFAFRGSNRAAPSASFKSADGQRFKPDDWKLPFGRRLQSSSDAGKRRGIG